MLHTPDPMTVAHKHIPSQGDYENVLRRLEQLVSGSAADLRELSACEEKHVQMNMNVREWRFVRVKTHGKRIPLSVFLARVKGKVVTYFNKSQHEPSEEEYDGVFYCDFFEISDSYCEFRAPVITLGFKCICEAVLTVTIHFGKELQLPTAQRPKSINPFNSVDTLAAKVKGILARREAQALPSPNHLKTNIAHLRRSTEDLQAWQAKERTKREQAMVKYREKLKEKKERVERAKLQRALRLEALEAAEAREKQRVQLLQSQKLMLQLLCFTSSTEALFLRFSKRKELMRQAEKVAFAVLMIQRCYRRVISRISPKRKTLQHALHHLSFFCGFKGPDLTYINRKRLFRVVKASCLGDRVNAAAKEFCRKVRIVQKAWKAYLVCKQDRFERLSRLWDAALRQLGESDAKTKKSGKNSKGSKGQYQDIERYPLLMAHLKSCQRQYYRDLSGYLHTAKVSRQSIKALTSLAKLPMMPEFHYLLSVEEMKALIQKSG